VRYISQVEFHPPLYYILLRGWTGLFGAAEAATRSLSLVFSLANVLLVYQLGKDLFRRRSTGLVAALVFAVLPMQIEFGQEARPYSMVCFAGTLAVLAMWRHLRGGGWKWAALYVAATVFGLYLHYSFFFIVAATSLWWLIEASMAAKGEHGRNLLAWLVVHAAVFLTFFPWLDAMLAKMLLSRLDIFGVPSFQMPYRNVGFFGIAYDQLIWLTKQKGVLQVVIFSQFLFKSCFVAAVLAVVARLERPLMKVSEGRAALLLVWLAVVPVALFLFAPFSVSYSQIIVRHLIIVTSPLALGMAAVAVALGRKRGTLLVVLLLVTLVPALAEVTGNDGTWDYFHRLRDVGEYVNDNYRPGDLVIIVSTAGRTDLTHFLREEIPVVGLLPLNYYGLDMWASRHVLGFVENESQTRSSVGINGIGFDVGGDGMAVSAASVGRKLDYLDKKYSSSRIWLYGFSDTDRLVHDWFTDHGWRHAFRSLGELFPVDLYVRPTP
jgi:hypothetical protein